MPLGVVDCVRCRISLVDLDLVEVLSAERFDCQCQLQQHHAKEDDESVSLDVRIKTSLM